MRIAFSCDDDRGLEGVMAHHFGRCPYYAFVDVEDGQVKGVEVVSNPYYGQHAPGVVPDFIHSQGAKVMITGGMGSRAVAFFDQYGIEVITGASGTVRYALDAYLQGRLGGAEPCGESRRHEAWGWQTPQARPQAYEQDELGQLREEIAALRRQLAEAQERLAKLER